MRDVATAMGPPPRRADAHPTGAVRHSHPRTRPMSSPYAPPSDSAVLVGGSPSDSDLLLRGEPAPREPDSYDALFRKEVAARICDILTKGYVTRREFVLKEAHKRGIPVEQLLASYIARVLMD